jgi:hypothetical protein
MLLRRHPAKQTRRPSLSRKAPSKNQSSLLTPITTVSNPAKSSRSALKLIACLRAWRVVLWILIQDDIVYSMEFHQGNQNHIGIGKLERGRCLTDF